ncbi:hypothetical protein GQ44DRAFT_774258 [Phaeosphaeriaceae sp. PMI808]|nr:hypothetical protein GQ44DRAFT_774258 [Phaeosphaeriaceae sp. PMI808]
MSPKMHEVGCNGIGGSKPTASKHSWFSSSKSAAHMFPRLSRPVPMMRPEYDVVVVGSGYGAGVAASRMARAGKRVAVLELGKEKWPGEYPSNLKEATPEVHVSGYLGSNDKPLQVEHGKRTGLYHLILGEGQNVFLGNGLGGTSLLNANVFIPADSRTLQLNAWPAEIRNNPDALKEYYARAEKMLQPAAYPPTYPSLKKLEVLEKQAKALGQSQNFYRAPQTTFFHDGLNNAGVEMKASTGSGQDCTGVNDGSKNSVLVTYLADAWNWGAEIFCECEVRYIEKDSERGGYLLSFAWLGGGRQAFGDDVLEKLMWVRAKELCILGAGALGTTEILLRSQKHGLKTSLFVGQKVSGNGDILSFAYNTDEIVNGVGCEHPNPKNPPGPTITGIIDNRTPETAKNVLDGYVIEEGVIPGVMAPLVQTILAAMPGKVRPRFNPLHVLRYLASALQSRVFGPYSKGGSVNRTSTYLLMSHDSNEGIIALKGTKPLLQFVGVGRTERVGRLHEVMTKATEAIGGTLVDGPLSVGYMREQLTVHPLGGAIMSHDGSGRSGAVDHIGRLFTGQGTGVHGGILCVDAAIIPTSLGINPFATITALAERACDLLLREKKWEVDETENGKLDLSLCGNFSGNSKVSYDEKPYLSHCYNESNDRTGVRFTEIMDGHIHVGDNIDDYEVAYNTARSALSSASLFITVEAFRVKNLTSSSDYSSVATGTLSCGALSPDPLVICDGRVHFFTVDDEVSDGTNLVYKLTLLTTKGETYKLYGYKTVDSAMAFSISQTWKATTALYTTITRPDGSLVGRGIINISWRNFVKELLSFGPLSSTLGGTGILAKIAAPVQFLSFFAKNTAKYFFSPLRRLQFPDKTTSGYLPKAAPVAALDLVADDGVKTNIKVWKPVDGAPKRTMPILFIPGASVDDQVFALPTIQTNTVEYFTALGYTCYVPTLRFGALQVAQEGYTAYDARLDVKAAMEYVREQEQGRKFYVVCHCLGSIATGLALLTGAVQAEWLTGMTCSQVFTNLRFGYINRIKSGTQLLVIVYKALAGNWFPSDSSSASPIFQRLVDVLLRFYPVGARKEICDSTVCRRCSLVFGRLWTHSKLNHATHMHLSNFFGGIHMNFLSHLTLMGSTVPHHSRNNQPLFEDVVQQPSNLDRLKGLKIQFLSGGANVVFDPWSTSESYDMLREKFGPENYERVVVAEYGHLDTWMGKDSCRDIYPRVQSHVEICEK